MFLRRIVPHEIKSPLVIEIRGVLALVVALVAGELDSFPIVPEMVRIIVMCETLAVVGPPCGGRRIANP